MLRELAEQETRRLAPLLGDRAEPLGGLARVAAARSQTPIVGQAPRPGEMRDRTNARRQGERRVRRLRPVERGNQTRVRVALGTLGNLLVVGRDLLVDQVPLRPRPGRRSVISIATKLRLNAVKNFVRSAVSKYSARTVIE